MIAYVLGGLLIVIAIGASYIGWLLWKKSMKYEGLASSHHELFDTHLEIKDLFDTASVECKDAQSNLQKMTELSVIKEVALTKGLLTLEASNTKMQELLVILKTREDDIKALKDTVAFQNLQHDKLLGQKKSSEVRTGKIVEQVSPFLADYPLDPKTARFIGDPIDFVHFDENMVTFIEVKSGKSQLSTKQRRIRDLINDKKVEFKIYRISGDGTNPS